MGADANGDWFGNATSVAEVYAILPSYNAWLFEVLDLKSLLGQGMWDAY